jgi:DNA-directed RNA polymerase specialized sigma24 family protein
LLPHYELYIFHVNFGDIWYNAKRGGVDLKNNPDDRQEFLQSVKPYTGSLFNVAHAITGNCELAELATQEALTDVFLARNKRRGAANLREELLRSTRSFALFELRSRNKNIDMDWRGFSNNNEGSPLIGWLSEESVEAQRVLTLKYGCGLQIKQVSDAMGLSIDEARATIKKSLSQLEKAYKRERQRPIEREISHEIKRYLSRPGSAASDPGAILRYFEQTAADIAPSKRVLNTAFRWFFMTLGVIICAVTFWVLAVLMER